METGTPSRTAFRVALCRAVHQVLDQPPVLDDPVAVPLLGSHFEFDRLREVNPIARAFRAFMAMRSRYAEDALAKAITLGVTQYVVLGAGLDTFAYRNPHAGLRVFEVDFPATQMWKRTLLEKAAIPMPEGLTFVALDFEQKTLAEGLADAGFEPSKPGFFGWLGVVPYLTREAFCATLETIVKLPLGTGVSFDYGLARETLGPLRRLAFDALAARVMKAGEPFRLLFTPDELDAEFRRAGFGRFEQHGPDELNALYFTSRSDGLKLPSPGLGKMASAWV